MTGTGCSTPSRPSGSSSSSRDRRSRSGSSRSAGSAVHALRPRRRGSRRPVRQPACSRRPRSVDGLSRSPSRHWPSQARPALAHLSLAALGGTAAVLDGPGRHALTSQLVAREELPNAIRAERERLNASRLLCSVLAGAVIASWTSRVLRSQRRELPRSVLALALMQGGALPVGRAEEPVTLVRGAREALATPPRAGVRAVLLLTAGSRGRLQLHVLVPLLAADGPLRRVDRLRLLASSFGAGRCSGALLSATIARASWTLIVPRPWASRECLRARARPPPATQPSLLFAIGACFTLESANSRSILQLSAPDHLRGLGPQPLHALVRRRRDDRGVVGGC